MSKLVIGLGLAAVVAEPIIAKKIAGRLLGPKMSPANESNQTAVKNFTKGGLAEKTSKYIHRFADMLSQSASAETKGTGEKSPGFIEQLLSKGTLAETAMKHGDALSLMDAVIDKTKKEAGTYDPKAPSNLRETAPKELQQFWESIIKKLDEKCRAAALELVGAAPTPGMDQPPPAMEGFGDPPQQRFSDSLHDKVDFGQPPQGMGGEHAFAAPSAQSQPGFQQGPMSHQQAFQPGFGPDQYTHQPGPTPDQNHFQSMPAQFHQDVRPMHEQYQMPGMPIVTPPTPVASPGSTMAPPATQLGRRQSLGGGAPYGAAGGSATRSTDRAKTPERPSSTSPADATAAEEQALIKILNQQYSGLGDTITSKSASAPETGSDGTSQSTAANLADKKAREAEDRDDGIAPGRTGPGVKG